MNLFVREEKLLYLFHSWITEAQVNFFNYSKSGQEAGKKSPKTNQTKKTQQQQQQQIPNKPNP